MIKLIALITITSSITHAAETKINTGEVATAITVQGNTFNGSNQLVKLEADGKLPILDGSNLTGLTAAGDNLGNHVATMTITAGYGISATTVSYNQMLPVNQTPYSGTSATPNSDYSMFVATATGGTLTLNNPSGTPVNGQKIILRIRDDGTARSLSWGNSYASGDIALPSLTVINKTMYIGFMFNSSTNKWELVGYVNNL